MKIFLSTSYILSLTVGAIADQGIRFIPATPENTTFVDGSAIVSKPAMWQWLPDLGNQGVFQSSGDPGNNADPMVITAKGLEPMRDYEVFGFFWSHGFGLAPADRGKQPHHWPARFGTGIASITTFGGRMSQDIPWIICPESKIGVRSGYQVALEEKNPLVKDVPKWITALDDTRLIRARLGVSRADKNGAIPVYADDFSGSKFTGLTRIDGIGLRLLPVGDREGVGSAKSGQLHLAVRAGDVLNMRRELLAGADVNALDEDGVTPLLYPATAGEREIVRELLKSGANPNQPGQSISPLTGAASWGDVEMVKLLLDAGAVVPNKLEERSPQLDGTLDPARLHPAIAAIRAGSLGCLKLILEKNPSLDLTKLEPVIDRKNRPDTWRTPDVMVKEAVGMVHDELAAFLVGRGCKVDHHGIMADCVSFGERMAKTREALLARGIPAVQPIPYNEYAGEYIVGDSVMPWDGLSAAVASGDINLTNRFLDLAKNVDERYLSALYALADTCGKPDILKAVQGKFPVRPAATSIDRNISNRNADEEAARLFLPRVGARKAVEKATGGSWNLAVLASPEAAGAAALVEVRASTAAQWQVLDRSVIEAALREDQNAKPWEKGEHRLSALGDRISADIILVVTKIAGAGIQVIRFEAVDVISGLVIHREYAEEKSLANEKTADVLLSSIVAAINRTRSNHRPLALSLLTFDAAKEIPAYPSLARQFKSSMEIEVDATPGFLSMGMNEINQIAQEQNLRGEGSFWAAACTLEGGIAALPDGRISLTLRLRNLTGGAEKPTDAKVEGSAQDIPALASKAWKQLVETAALPVKGTQQIKPDAKQTALEAARLTREAQWLVLCRRPKEAKPLAERAVMLGADSETIVPIVLACLIDALPYKASPPLRNFGFSYYLPVDSVPSISYQRALIDKLDALSELLEKSEFLYQQRGRDSFQWKRDPTIFWTIVQTLCYSRSIIPTHLLTPAQADQFQTFCVNLDRFTKEYMGDFARAQRELDPKRFFLRIDNGRVSPRMLQCNPSLSEGLASSLASQVNRQSVVFENLIQRRYQEKPNSIVVMEKIMSALPKHMEKLAPEPKRALELQMQINQSIGDATSLLMRDCQRERLNSGRNSYLYLTYGIMSGVDDLHYGLRMYFRMWEAGLPARKNLVLHSLFHEPSSRPDCLVRCGYLMPDRWSLQSTLQTMEFSTNARMNSNSRRDELIRWGKEELSKSLANDTQVKQTNGRVEALVDVDLMYGLDVYNPVLLEWKKLTDKPSQKSVITPTLLTDLRSRSVQNPGIFDLYAADTSSPDRLWLRYRSFANGLSRADGHGVFTDKIRELGATLCAIDGKTGEIKMQTSLSSYTELQADHQQMVPPQGSGTAVFAQNKTTLLTQVGWVNDQYPWDWRGSYALIDKTTGKTTLIKGLTIRHFTGYPQHQGTCVEVIDDAFFMLGRRSAKYDSSAKYELLRMDEQGTQTYLTQIGRKPELTPFDSEDRPPAGMVRDGSSLIIFDDNKRHVARYESKSATWSTIEGDDRTKYGEILKSIDESYKETFAPARKIAMPDGKSLLEIKGDGGTWPGTRVFFPGTLSINLPGRKNVELHLNIDFPADYMEKARFIDVGFMKSNKMLPDQISTVKELQQQKRLHPVVLCQTDTHLIIGLRIKPWQDISFDEHNAFLPFLWTLPKSTLFDALGLQSSSINPSGK